jgi:nitrogen fixation protein NifB
MLEDAGIAPNGEHAMEPIEDAVFEVYKEMVEQGKLEESEVAQQAGAK